MIFFLKSVVYKQGIWAQKLFRELLATAHPKIMSVLKAATSLYPPHNENGPCRCEYCRADKSYRAKTDSWLGDMASALNLMTAAVGRGAAGNSVCRKLYIGVSWGSKFHAEAERIMICADDQILESAEWRAFYDIMGSSDAPVYFLPHWVLCKEYLLRGPGVLASNAKQRARDSTCLFSCTIKMDLRRKNDLSVQRQQQGNESSSGKEPIAVKGASRVIQKFEYAVQENKLGNCTTFGFLARQVEQFRVDFAIALSKRQREIPLAFAMGTHKRLGSSCFIRQLPDEVVAAIGALVQQDFDNEFGKLLELLTFF